ncbi:unnamed protein product [Lathyrus oleraceus]
MKKLVYILCLVTISIGHIVDCQEIQSNLINKSPIKSIRLKSGNIVDCININKQPAFDNPLLKNHKLQQKPSFGTNLMTSPIKSISAFEKIKCPKGYVPIPRNTQDKSLHNYHILDANNPVTYNAGAYVKGNFSYGASGTACVYNPKVSKSQISGSALHVRGGLENNISQILLGWHVYPDLYHDDKSHIFALWNSNNFKTGCYNTMCPGFIQTDNSLYLGQPIQNTSIYGTEIIMETLLSISQDVKTNNWWVTVQNKALGYFPTEIFSNLREATQVGWGGFVLSGAGEDIPFPPMGSGHFEELNLLHSSYITHIQYLNATRTNGCPMYKLVNTPKNLPTKCYDVEYYGERSEALGCFVLFGGPGGKCNS